MCGLEGRQCRTLISPIADGGVRRSREGAARQKRAERRTLRGQRMCLPRSARPLRPVGPPPHATHGEDEEVALPGVGRCALDGRAHLEFAHARPPRRPPHRCPLGRALARARGQPRLRPRMRRRAGGAGRRRRADRRGARPRRGAGRLQARPRLQRPARGVGGGRVRAGGAGDAGDPVHPLGRAGLRAGDGQGQVQGGAEGGGGDRARRRALRPA